AVRRLWDACCRAISRSNAPQPAVAAAPVRHRDAFLAAFGIEVDAWIHPPLIRFLAGYLDQGLAHWPMPERSRGIHGCFLEPYGSPLAAQCGPRAPTPPRPGARGRPPRRNPAAPVAGPPRRPPHRRT